MQKIQLIKNTLGERFAKYGFEFLGSIDRGFWRFRKTLDNGVEQFIDFQKSRFGYQEISICLRTTYYQGRMYVCDFANEPQYSNKWDWFYKDDAEFVKILEEMGDIIEKYGLDKLEELSIPEYKYEPTEEMHRRLFEKYDELAKQFKEKHNINENLTLKDSMFLLKDMLEKYDRREYDDETKEWLLEMAAFYGERMIRRYYGCWRWNDKLASCEVANMQHIISQFVVISNIIHSWEKASGEILLLTYEIFRDGEKDPYFNGKRYAEPVINKDF